MTINFDAIRLLGMTKARKAMLEAQHAFLAARKAYLIQLVNAARRHYIDWMSANDLLYILSLPESWAYDEITATHITSAAIGIRETNPTLNGVAILDTWRITIQNDTDQVVIKHL